MDGIDNTGRRLLLLTAAIAAALMLSMTTCNGSRVALAIDEFTLSKSDKVTVGSGSDIAFSRLPAQQLTVSLADDGASWDITVSHTDTLPYYKVNEANPNKHALSPDDRINVVADGKAVDVSVGEMRNAGALAGHHSQYVLLADALQCCDSTLRTGMLHGVRSFLFRDESQRERDDAQWHLVILDKFTTLVHNGEKTGYAFKFNTGEAGTHPARLCKLQFWQMSRNTYRQQHTDRYFTLNGVNVVAKPTLITTDWGAGHLMLRSDDGRSTTVSFPKPVTYVERIDTLRSWAAPYAGLLTLCQSGDEFPAPCAMLIPAFSGRLNSELCNLITGGDSLALRAPDGTSRRLAGRWLAPVIDSYHLAMAGGSVTMRAGVIDGGFALAYLLPMLLAFAVLALAAWHTFDDRRLRKGMLCGYGHRRGTRQLVLVILAVAATYCIAKCMIAFKLSYTYPYFDKLTAVTPVNGALVLLLAFSLMVLFNHSHVYITRDRAVAGVSRLAGAWTALAVTTAGLVASAVYLTAVLDPGVTPAVMDSYLPGEVFTANVLRWNELVGINDLHRSVPYTLMLAVALTIVLQAACLAHALVARKAGKPAAGPLARVPWWGITAAALVAITLVAALVPGNFATALITLLVVMSLSHSARHIMTMEAPAARRQRMVLLPVAAIAALLAAVMLVMGLTFSRGAGVSLVTIALAIALTAVIVVLVRNCRDSEAVQQRVFRFVLLLAAAVAHFAAAVGFGAGDMGYFTNFVGFVVFVYVIYALSFKSAHIEQSDPAERRANEIERRQLGWLFAGLTVMLVLTLHVFVPNYMLDADKVDFGRGTRRMSLSADFNRYSRSGYRYAVQDVEFMIVMDHYLNWNRGADPLNNESKPLHPSVSSGQSPVVLNDVSLQAAFLGAYGMVAYLAYALLLVALAWAVAHHSLPDRVTSRQSKERGKALTVSRTTAWRLLAMLMWVGTTVYLFLSYMGWLPFTGRLNPGLGVDAVGEALESAVLLAFMTATSHTVE